VASAAHSTTTMLKSLFSRVASRTSQRWASSNTTAPVVLLKSRSIPLGGRAGLCTSTPLDLDAAVEKLMQDPDSMEFRAPSKEELDEYERGWIDWEEMLHVQKEADLYWNVDIASDLVVAFGKTGKLDRVKEVFNLALDKSVDAPNTYLINCMMNAMNRCNEPQQALSFAELHLHSAEGLQLRPNADSYKSMLVSCSKIGDATKAMEVFDRVQASSEKLEFIGFRALLVALGKDQSGYGEVNSALDQISAAMEKRKVRMNAELTGLFAEARQ